MHNALSGKGFLLTARIVASSLNHRFLKLSSEGSRMAQRPENTLIPRVSDEPAVSEGWNRFVEQGALPDGRVRDVVADSWRRCREAVDPRRASAPAIADSGRLLELRSRQRDLYEAAKPVLGSLRDVLRESGTVILLADPVGTILDLGGDTRTRSAGEQINLAAGGCWLEDVIGTNAIGTAIAMRQPVQIYASEHYCVDVKRWTCAAAPILDRYGRTLLGVIDVSGVKETFHGHTLGLVMAAAKQIESLLLGRELELQGKLLEAAMDAFGRYGTDCVILFDQRGRMVRGNGRLQAAREMHGLRLPLETGARVAALDLALPIAERLCAAPPWLKPEWLTPVRNREGDLGTLLVIPLSAAPAPVRPQAVPAEPDPGPFADLTGNSPALAALKKKAARLAQIDLPVLLLGETGAGKEVVARAIHRAGIKTEAPFIAVNCGALTRDLLASELFGYADGAFTGARRGGLPGKFEQADGGTLFLDEIGEMPPDMQPHLLRVLQDGVVVRLGDHRERRVSVRIIAATNRDLRAEVAAGRFREDIYHRLCVTSLELPPLRERADDIPLIVERMNLHLAAKYGCAPKRIDPVVREAFQRYRWPGNVRELKNVFEAMFALGEDDCIDAAQLPSEIARAATSSGGRPASGRLQDVERQAVTAAIADAKGNLSQAARSLGISRSTLYVKLAEMRERAGTGPSH
jgi:transcriptional regulator of acetoin/glycerol metabolism